MSQILENVPSEYLAPESGELASLELIHMSELPPQYRALSVLADQCLRVHPIEEYTDSQALCRLWDSIVGEVGDVYYEIPYLLAAAESEGGQIMLAVYHHPLGLVIYPYVQRSLDDVSIVSQAPDARYDITSPYEYGGPLVWADAKADRLVVQAGFSDAFAAHCRSEGIISEFVRFHPMLRTQEGWGSSYELRKSCANVIVDLSKDPESILAGYSTNHRRNVRVAQDRGVRVERAGGTLENIHKFVDIYHPTMARVKANSFFYFSLSYFERISQLGDDLVSLYFARSGDGQVASAALFLHGAAYVHYHLGGTVDEMRGLRPNNLLFHTVAMETRRAGKQYLHLGGAASDQRGLLAFKEGFSSDRSDYYVGQRVHDPTAYEALCTAWRDANPEKAAASSGSFFPLYRS